MWARENHATNGQHVRIAVGTVVASRYEIVGEAGSGNFARVFEARDLKTGQKVALKFMKPGYERDADFEVDVLTAVNQKDPGDTCGIVRYVERLRHHGYTALVFTLKGKPLRGCRLPMPRDDIRRVIKDVAAALAFLHVSCKAVHTDLKPENILAEVATSASGRSWCLCDFGSASFHTGALDTDLITTRPYRAPEVVLKRGWSFQADTWSLGCIVYELFTGKKLFDAHSDGEHLELMQARLGPIPASMYPPRTSGIAARGVPLREELKGEPDLLNLLEATLQYDPVCRIACADILRHPFLVSCKDRPSSAVSGGMSAPLGVLSSSATNARAAPTGKTEVHPLFALPKRIDPTWMAPTSLPLRASFTRTATAPTLPLDIRRQGLTSPAFGGIAKHPPAL